MSKDRWPSGKEKTRVVFILTDDAAESGEERHTFETPGWIEDENALRSALARSIKTEGVADSWDEIGKMAHSATYEWVRSESNAPVTRAHVVPL